MMWERLVHHFEDSRLHLRSNKPSITFKRQTEFLHGRLTLKYPLSFDGDLYFSNTGFENASFHPNFSPNVPFHVHVSSDKSYQISCNIKMKNEQLPENFRNNTLTFGLSGIHNSYLAGVIALTHKGKASISLALNPCILGAFFHGENIGAEFAYSFAEEQPSMSAMFNKRFDRTEVSLMASMYGEATALITSDFDKVRISSYLKANPFTFASTAIFGLQIPFGNSFGNISFAIPSKTISFEAALNYNEDSGSKNGVTIHLPFNTSVITSILA